jgi:imidazolonepropionase-like amidohydrolase
MSGPIAISGATGLLGPELTAVAGSVVVVDGATIAACGAISEISVPPGAEMVDAMGLTLAPGFIDAHVHIGLADPRAVLAGGITTVRDLAWPPERIFPLVEAARDPSFDGPTIVAAGAMLTVEGGYPTRAAWAPPGTGLALSSRRDADEAVGALARRGANVIKVALNPAVGPTPSLDLLAAIVAAARGHDLRVTAHTYGLEELHKALDAGVDELAHMLMSPERIPDDFLRRMVAAGMTIVPTLSIFEGGARRVAVDNLGRFRALGGRIVYGTDLGNYGPRPGIEAREVTGMVAAGMTPREVVAAATATAAAWIGLPSAGVIAPGRDADLVALAGRPLERARDLVNVVAVWRRGRRAR